jgi:hypothetical protein
LKSVALSSSLPARSDRLQILDINIYLNKNTLIIQDTFLVGAEGFSRRPAAAELLVLGSDKCSYGRIRRRSTTPSTSSQDCLASARSIPSNIIFTN